MILMILTIMRLKDSASHNYVQFHVQVFSFVKLHVITWCWVLSFVGQQYLYFHMMQSGTHLFPPTSPLNFLSPLSFSSCPSGPDLRTGSDSRRVQDHQIRLPPQPKRPARPRQVQDLATDPAGKHQAEDRRVWVLINATNEPEPSPPPLIGLYASFLENKLSRHTSAVQKSSKNLVPKPLLLVELNVFSLFSNGTRSSRTKSSSFSVLSRGSSFFFYCHFYYCAHTLIWINWTLCCVVLFFIVQEEQEPVVYSDHSERGEMCCLCFP